MAITLKYSKSQYQAKITELEGYYTLLDQHLTKMQELREQMFYFWNDPKAQTAGQILSEQMRVVQKAMTRTKDTIIFYQSAVDKMDSAGNLADELLRTALGILAGL